MRSARRGIADAPSNHTRLSRSGNGRSRIETVAPRGSLRVGCWMDGSAARRVDVTAALVALEQPMLRSKACAMVRGPVPGQQALVVPTRLSLPAANTTRGIYRPGD